MSGKGIVLGVRLKPCATISLINMQVYVCVYIQLSAVAWKTVVCVILCLLAVFFPVTGVDRLDWLCVNLCM